MSFDAINSELAKLYESVSLTQQDIDGVDIFELPPSNKVNPIIIKQLKEEKKLKYLILKNCKTKEEKMLKTLEEIVNQTSAKLLTELKNNGTLLIEYSRAYKSSTGGPVITVVNGKDKVRFGEINNKFPIENLVEEMLKYGEP